MAVGVGLGLSALIATGAVWADPSNGGANPGHPIQLMHQDPWFITVAAASMAGWILGAVKGFSTSADWLRKYIAKPPVLLVFFSDLFLFVVAGAYLGTGIYTPTNFVSAIAAGLTWPIGLGALATSDRPSLSQAREPELHRPHAAGAVQESGD